MYLLFCVRIFIFYFIGIVRSNSCIGVKSCINSSGRIGSSSCQANGSCRYNSWEIENESCGDEEVRKNLKYIVIFHILILTILFPSVKRLVLTTVEQLEAALARALGHAWEILEKLAMGHAMGMVHAQTIMQVRNRTRCVHFLINDAYYF